MAVMSKLSIRARNVDSNKSLPIIRAEEIPDLEECSLLPRNVVLFSTGMEKEEEEETHLQEALSALQYGLRAEKEAANCRTSFIPIPESNIAVENYQEFYADKYKCSKQYIQYREKLFDDSFAEYDADTEDEAWLESTFSTQSDSETSLSKSAFEHMMEKLEKSSGQQVTSAVEAKSLLNGDDDTIMHVYDYWLAKRLRWRQALLPFVKIDRRDLVGDPYVAFRRRMDRVQTRKNRKNDEISYEKMLRLRKDFHRALEIIELMKDRENTKQQLLSTEVDIIELRRKADLISNALYREILQMVKNEMENRALQKPKSSTTTTKPLNGMNRSADHNLMSELKRKRKKLRKDSEVLKSKDKVKQEVDEKRQSDITKTMERQYAFKRAPSLNYHGPSTMSSLCDPMQWPNTHLHYSLTNISTVDAEPELAKAKHGDERNHSSIHRYLDTNRNVGYCRRRIGRGGRVVFDRIRCSAKAKDSDLPLDDSQMECHALESNFSCLPNQLWSHFLDHSYSLFSAEYPQEIPVYLPKAKRHQSLPPDNEFKEAGSSLTTEQIWEACGPKQSLNTEEDAVINSDKHLAVYSSQKSIYGSLSDKDFGERRLNTKTSVHIKNSNSCDNVSNSNISFCSNRTDAVSFEKSKSVSLIGGGNQASRDDNLSFENRRNYMAVSAPSNGKHLKLREHPSAKSNPFPKEIVDLTDDVQTATVTPNGAAVREGGRTNNSLPIRTSNTAALLLNNCLDSEKGFAQSVSSPLLPAQNSLKPFITGGGCTLNNNKHDLLGMRNGSVSENGMELEATDNSSNQPPRHSESSQTDTTAQNNRTGFKLTSRSSPLVNTSLTAENTTGSEPTTTGGHQHGSELVSKMSSWPLIR